MSKKSFLPHGDEAKRTWLNNFDEKLPSYATKFGLVKAETDSVHNDRLAYEYGLLLVDSSKTFDHQCCKYKDSIKDGVITNLIIDIPNFTAPASPPIAVAPGIFRRISKLIKKLKAHAAYTEDIGKDLGVIGAEYLGKVNPNDYQVKITAEQSAGDVKIKYKKGDFDGIKLECKRGNETEFTLVDKITLTVYLDERDVLVAGQPEIRQYRAWPIVKDKVVGKVSDVVSITVTPV